jgi:ribonuclease HII
LVVGAVVLPVLPSASSPVLPSASNPLGAYPFRDSKVLSPGARKRLAEEVKRVALAWGIGVAEVEEVDQLGVLEATHLAAARALAGLEAEALVTDYLFLKTPLPILSPPRAEEGSPSVAAASILAKVHRDLLMEELDRLYPGYGFARHKGYGTREHQEALRLLGPSPVHRKSFRPVAQGLLLSPD